MTAYSNYSDASKILIIVHTILTEFKQNYN